MSTATLVDGVSSPETLVREFHDTNSFVTRSSLLKTLERHYPGDESIEGMRAEIETLVSSAERLVQAFDDCDSYGDKKALLNALIQRHRQHDRIAGMGMLLRKNFPVEYLHDSKQENHG